MRVTVDRDKCDGFGFCEQAAPHIFELDDDGELQILVEDIPESDRVALEAAIRSCPVAALRMAS